MKVEFRHQQPCHAGKNEHSSTKNEEALECRGGKQESRTNRCPPNKLEFVKHVQVRVRVTGNVLFDQGHANVQATDAIRIVTCFNNPHQLLIDDDGSRFMSIQVLTERKLHHIFSLKGKNRSGSDG